MVMQTDKDTGSTEHQYGPTESASALGRSQIAAGQTTETGMGRALAVHSTTSWHHVDQLSDDACTEAVVPTFGIVVGKIIA